MKRILVMLTVLTLFSCSKDDTCDEQAIRDKYADWLSDPQLSDRQYEIYMNQMNAELKECN